MRNFPRPSIYHTPPRPSLVLVNYKTPDCDGGGRTKVALTTRRRRPRDPTTPGQVAGSLLEGLVGWVEGLGGRDGGRVEGGGWREGDCCFSSGT